MDMHIAVTDEDLAESHRNLGPVERIPPGEGRAYQMDGETVAVFRTRTGGVYAVQATCPHAGGPLVDGLIGDGRVICPLHSHVFDLASGESLRGDCPNLRTFSISISEAGDLLLSPESRKAS